MADQGTNRFEKYLAGLNRPEPAQSRGGKDGDPQLAALHQLLANRASLYGNEGVIIDIGSGAGILATAIAKVWGNRDSPRYIAVDREAQLEELALPVSVHNNSEKITFPQFFDHEISRFASKQALVVIRNVFHELNIDETAYVLANLNLHLDLETTIYVQDMQRLPVAERGNAGWDARCFECLLHNLEMKTQFIDLRSHSGIKWFAAMTAPTGRERSKEQVALVCAEQRRRQKQQMLLEVEQLNRDYTEKTAPDVTVLSLEIANIEMQLGKHEQERGATNPNKSELDIGGILVPLKPSSERQGFSVAYDREALTSETGLAAALRTKDITDIPKLIDSANQIIWFAGYSNRFTFETIENRAALAKAMSRGIDFRAILCEPESPVASIRAAEPVYASNEELIHQIKSSLSFARTFLDEVYNVLPANKRGTFGVRLTTSIPSCSYFFIDRLCFASFYTSRMGGNVAPTFIFRSAGVGKIGFYEILKEEFQQTYSSASDAFRDRSLT